MIACSSYILKAAYSSLLERAKILRWCQPGSNKRKSISNSTLRNAILLHSYYMAPWQKSKIFSAVVDKGRRVFSNTISPSTTSRKKFKNNDAQRDMSVLAMTYILQDNSTIRELISLIIGLNDHDDSGKVCTTCNPW